MQRVILVVEDGCLQSFQQEVCFYLPLLAVLDSAVEVESKDWKGKPNPGDSFSLGTNATSSRGLKQSRQSRFGTVSIVLWMK